MIQNNGEEIFQNNNNNEIQKELQNLYSKTSPLNKSPIEKQGTNNINSPSQIQYKTTIDNNKQYINNDLNIKNNITTPSHNETSLVKNLQYLDEDNINLREALSELNLELKEKEEALNESQKILRKINDEYSQMVKEFKKLEEEKSSLQEENEKNKKMLDNLNKNLNEYDKIVKQNEQLKEELIKTKDIMNNLKGNYTNVTNDFNKIEKDNKIKEIIIKDLKIEGSKIINMLQDRDLLIQSYSKKIADLNELIKQKDDQIKLMVNFSKEINNENKLNVKELTKQAVKTIKVFYNSMSNNDNTKQKNFIEIKKSDADKTINKNMSEIIFGNNNNNSDKKSKCSFLLNEAIKDVLYIPNVGVNHINKEFLIDNNFKTCLIKTELFSTIIREVELYSFFSNIFSKLKEAASSFNMLDNQNKKKAGENVKYLTNIKKFFDKINKNLVECKKENITLKKKLKELILYINKLKKDIGVKNEKIKKNLKNIDDNYNKYIFNLEEKNKTINKVEENNKLLDDKNKKQISKLYQEIDSIKNINNNMNQEIQDKDEIINNLKIENEKLLYKLNTFRTNPNAENNFKFYNSFSVNYNNNIKEKTKISRNKKNADLNEYSNYNDIKYNTKNISNSNNDYFFDYSINDNVNDNISNNSMKYSTKATSKIITNRKNIRRMIRDMNDISNNYNENDITNIFIKSNNSKNNNFTNLKIQKQDKIIYLINEESKRLNNEQYWKSLNSVTPIPTAEKNNYASDFQSGSGLFERELLKNIFSIINDFKSVLKEDEFIDLTNKNFKIHKIIQLLNTKIEEIKNNLSNIKDKFKDNHNGKKIKPAQLVDIMDQVEKLLLYVNNHLNKANNDMQSIQPYFKNIFDLISKIVYDSPLYPFNNTCDITPFTMGLNSLQNSFIINNKYKNTIKDDILKNNDNIKNSDINDINKNKITDEEIEDIINNHNNSTKTKESLFPNIQELRQFFDINKKIFSSSELIKYRTIYEGLSISKLIKVFKNICDNLKKTIYNSKNEYDSDLSDIDESSHYETKNSQIPTDNNSYHIVNQKIFGLKKFEFNYKIFMELLKNYLVTFEIIVNQIEIEIQKNNKEKQIELGKELNILYNIFEDAVYFKMDRLDDDIIFNRKILLKLLLNHKEYLSIIYDI